MGEGAGMWSARRRNSVFGFSTGIQWRDNHMDDYSGKRILEVFIQFLWWRIEYIRDFAKRR